MIKWKLKAKRAIRQNIRQKHIHGYPHTVENAELNYQVYLIGKSSSGRA